MNVNGSATTDSGFTLIELLVVISIISLISSSVLTGFQSVRSQARDRTRVQQLQQISSAIELYINEQGQVPIESEADNPFYISSCSESSSWNNPSASQGYLPDMLNPHLSGELPSDPLNENPYCYMYTPRLYPSSPTECQADQYALLFKTETDVIKDIPQLDPTDSDPFYCIQN